MKNGARAKDLRNKQTLTDEELRFLLDWYDELIDYFEGQTVVVNSLRLDRLTFVSIALSRGWNEIRLD